jgi:DNA-binding response OmpR family regulator
VSGERILVVDDEAALLDGVAFALRRAGYSPETAANGEDALQRIERESFDVAILDVMLPGLSGFDLCRRLREDGDMPIILLTARDAESDRVFGLESGADDYVVKPFSTRELVSRVHSILRRRQLDAEAATRSHAYAVAELRIDLLQHTADWAGSPLRLTDSEYRILAFLAEKRGAPVSRHEIVRRLWNSDHVGDERVCDVHVHAIRRKISQAGGDSRIVRTVRGEGYALRL